MQNTEIENKLCILDKYLLMIQSDILTHNIVLYEKTLKMIENLVNEINSMDSNIIPQKQ